MEIIPSLGFIHLQKTEDLLELAAKVYQGLSDEQINEIEQIALNRRSFFGGSSQSDSQHSCGKLVKVDEK